MTITSLLGFLSLVGWLAVVGGAVIAIANASQNRSARPGVMLALIGVVVGVLFFFASAGLVEIAPNEVGVVFQQIGGDPATHSLWPQPLGPGIHIILPIINQVTIYSTESQNYTMAQNSNEGQVKGDDSVAARTQDGQQAAVDITVIYNVDPANVNTLHIKWQQRYTDDFVRVNARSAAYNLIANYSAQDLYTGTKRNELQGKLLEQLKPAFEENGLLLTQVQVRQITFSDVFTKSVEDKQVAQQQAEQALQQAARTRTIAQGDADAVVTKAQGDAKALVANANGEAEAIKVKAAADAQALGLINEQLSKNPLLLQWRYIEKLAGNVQLVLVPSNTPFLFNPADLINKLPASASSSTSSSASASTPAPAPTAAPTTTP
ncbi:MAG TPA: prohibitin family protein [Aggregatilineales bacterium]|nr:prohibitin family protein [Aggregatilineales bacterium]